MLSDTDAAVVALYLINQKESSKSGTNEDHNTYTRKSYDKTSGEPNHYNFVCVCVCVCV